MLTLEKRQTATHAYAVLAFSMMVTSFAAICVRLALDAGMASVVVPGLRLILASLVLTPLVFSRYGSQLRALSHAEIGWAMVAGASMSIHFTLMSVALEYTAVMIAQVIVNTSPIWVAALETVFLRARLPRSVYFGLVLVIAGSGFIGLSNADTSTAVDAGSNPNLGALLAFLSSLMAAVYITVGRKVRSGVGLVPYVWLLYTGGALTSIVFMLVFQTSPFGYSGEAYFWVIVLVVGPHLIGHSGINYVVKYIQATIVSISSQSVSVASGIIAFSLFGEFPRPLALIGSVVIIVGVVLAIVSRRPPEPSDR